MGEAIRGPARLRAVLCALLVLAAFAQPACARSRSRTVRFQHGRLVFRIPAGWESVPDGSDLVCCPDRGRPYPTLRVNVLSATGPRRVTDPDLERLVGTGPGGRRVLVARSARGYPVSCAAGEVNEDFGLSAVRLWKVGQLMVPSGTCVATFLLMLPPERAQGPRERALVDLIDREVRRARLASDADARQGSFHYRAVHRR